MTLPCLTRLSPVVDWMAASAGPISSVFSIIPENMMRRASLSLKMTVMPYHCPSTSFNTKFLHYI